MHVLILPVVVLATPQTHHSLYTLRCCEHKQALANLGVDWHCFHSCLHTHTHIYIYLKRTSRKAFSSFLRPLADHPLGFYLFTALCLNIRYFTISNEVTISSGWLRPS